MVSCVGLCKEGVGSLMTVSLDLAIAAIKAGRKEEGRQLLNLLIQQDPNAEFAWLWMSSVVKTDEQRARCLYHVLSINPKNELAHRGLQILGITVSDSRPVKVPRDSEPIHIPNPSITNGSQPEPKLTPEQQVASSADSAVRRPFLIDMKAITAELPFVPARPPVSSAEEIQASPDILALKVDDSNQPKKSDPNGAMPAEMSASSANGKSDDASAEALARAVIAPEAQSTDAAKPDAQSQQEQSQKINESDGGHNQSATDIAEEPAAARPQAEQEMSALLAGASDEKSPIIAESPGGLEARNTAASSESASTNSGSDRGNLTKVVQDDNDLSQSAADGQKPSAPGYAVNGEGMPPPGQPFETRPSQPVPINSPVSNMGLSPNDPAGYGATLPDQQYQHYRAGTLPMPHYPMIPGSMPVHGNPTMGMPYGQYQRHPSEPVPVIIHPNSILPPSAYPPGHSFHSSATTLMPTFSEVGMAQGQAIPTASGTAMPLQNMGWGVHPEFRSNADPHPPHHEEDEADEEDREVNILAVIIFGTLSLTALGGIGMLILLFITTSSVPG
jgi:hypothetical protein